MAVNPASPNAAPQITGAIQQAARSSGISFEYLLTTAQIESNLNPAAQASTSSAKGLYQFIEQTWLGTLKSGGAATGYGRYADAITRSADGHYEVADPTMRAAIMQLRSDPSASAMMAGAFTRANANQLQSAIGRAPTEGELYIAHFLGSDGASKLIATASAQPNANAADMFPQAAAANRSIFYDGVGRPRSASDVYARLSSRFEVARAVSFMPDLATAKVSRIAGAQTSAPAATRPSPSSPDTAGVTQAFAVVRTDLPPPQPADSQPLFQSMFTDRTRKAVTQTVSSLWAPSSKTPAPADAQRPLDLFTDIRPESRRLLGEKS
jgi:Transglycosylase SLT domain